MSNTIKVGLIGMGEGTMYAADFNDQLEQADNSKPLIIDFHSEGGSVFEGFEIANLIRDYPGKTVARIRSAAFSIASYCAIACDEIEIADNGFFMIHNPYSTAEGDDQDHARTAKLLNELKTSLISAYSDRTGKSAAEITELMKAETYFNANESIEVGLADRVINRPATVKPLSQNQNLPVAVFVAMYGSSAGDENPTTEIEKMSKSEKSIPATVKAIKSAFPKARSEFIVRCMEEELDMEDVGEEYAKSMEEENEELLAKCAELEEELTAMKAAMEEEEMAKSKAEEEKEEQPVARSGLRPVAATIGAINGEPVDQQWENLVNSFVAKGKTRINAVCLANKANPELRKAMIKQAN